MGSGRGEGDSTKRTLDLSARSGASPLRLGSLRSVSSVWSVARLELRVAAWRAQSADIPMLLSSIVALCCYAPSPLAPQIRMLPARAAAVQMQMMKPGDWTCEMCGASPNFARRTECFKCGAPRSGSSGGGARRPQSQREQWPPSQGPDFKQGDWTCGECGASPVFASRMDCFRCGAPKPAGAGFDAPRGSRDEQWPSSQGPEFRENFEGTRCFVENLSFDTDWRALKDAFSYEGYPIVYASVSTERDSGRSKGHGIVQFETAHAAEHAIAEMTGYEVSACRACAYVTVVHARPCPTERAHASASDPGVLAPLIPFRSSMAAPSTCAQTIRSGTGAAGLRNAAAPAALAATSRRRLSTTAWMTPGIGAATPVLARGRPTR